MGRAIRAQDAGTFAQLPAALPELTRPSHEFVLAIVGQRNDRLSPKKRGGKAREGLAVSENGTKLVARRS
jgi:hypothetical protein